MTLQEEWGLNPVALDDHSRSELRLTPQTPMSQILALTSHECVPSIDIQQGTRLHHYYNPRS